jgi:hypothetical protein
MNVISQSEKTRVKTCAEGGVRKTKFGVLLGFENEIDQWNGVDIRLKGLLNLHSSYAFFFV